MVSPATRPKMVLRLSSHSVLVYWGWGGEGMGISGLRGRAARGRALCAAAYASLHKAAFCPPPLAHCTPLFPPTPSLVEGDEKLCAVGVRLVLVGARDQAAVREAQARVELILEGAPID